LVLKSVKERTGTDYLDAVERFVEWGLAQGDDDPLLAEDVDELLVLYFQHLYDAGCSQSEAQKCRAGISFVFPALRRCLGWADRALAGWELHEPHVSWPPITYGLVLGAAVALWETGQPAAAVGLLLGFECYLRNSEVCNLQVKDLALPGDARIGALAGIAMVGIFKAKTGKFQFVRIRDPLVLALLRHITAGAAPEDQLLPGLTPSRFRAALREGLRLLGFPDAPYVIHSLRHGGAVHDYLIDGQSLETVMETGRWVSTKSARTYLQSGRVLLLQQVIPVDVQAMIVVLELDRGAGFGMPGCFQPR